MDFRIPDWLRHEVQYRWEQVVFNTRKWINKHPKIIASIATVSVFVLLVVVIALLIPEKQEATKIEIYIQLEQMNPHI